MLRYAKSLLERESFSIEIDDLGRPSLVATVMDPYTSIIKAPIKPSRTSSVANPCFGSLTLVAPLTRCFLRSLSPTALKASRGKSLKGLIVYCLHVLKRGAVVAQVLEGVYLPSRPRPSID